MKKIGIALLLCLMTGLSTAFFGAQQEKVAIVSLSGSITPSSSSGLVPEESVTPEKVRKLNERALDSGADAIIYEINSPGGAVVASKEVKREIEDVAVPTVCRMRDTAASGGYLISLGCDRILADSATLTGSIGVRASFLEFSGLLDRLGVEYVNVTAGRLKDAGSRFTNASEEEKELLREKVRIVQDEFISQVDDERNLTENQLEKVSTGQVLLGKEAEDLNLVDDLGGREQAIETAEILTGADLKTFEVQTSSNLDLFSLLFSSVEFSFETFPSLEARF